MTSKQKVHAKYPIAYPERINRGGPFKEHYYIIWSKGGSDKLRLGDGDTISKAWVDAANYLQDIADMELLKQQI